MHYLHVASEINSIFLWIHSNKSRCLLDIDLFAKAWLTPHVKNYAFFVIKIWNECVSYILKSMHNWRINSMSNDGCQKLEHLFKKDREKENTENCSLILCFLFFIQSVSMTIRLLLTFLLLVMCQHNVNCFIGVKKCKFKFWNEFDIFTLNNFKRSLWNESFESFKVTTSPDADQTPRTINFLTKEIQIPDGVSDAIVSEIQKILNSYENPMLTYGQQLVDCVELKSPFEVCSSISNQFEVISSNF